MVKRAPKQPVSPSKAIPFENEIKNTSGNKNANANKNGAEDGNTNKSKNGIENGNTNKSKNGNAIENKNASGNGKINEGKKESKKAKSTATLRRLRWTAADIAVGAVLGVACGLVFWGFNFAYAWISPILGAVLPGIASVLHAFWYFSGTLSVIILRKPGAALYTNLVGVAAEMLLGNQFSFAFVAISAILQGVFAELPFAVTRYRRFTLPLSMLSGGLVALEYGVYLMLFRYQGVDFFSPRGIIHMVSEIIGGVLIAGVMSWYLYRAIASTGALDRFASGRAARFTDFDE